MVLFVSSCGGVTVGLWGSANVWWVSASLAGGFRDRSRGHLLNANRGLTGKGWVGTW